jgi:hypothetical protein
VDLHDAQGGKSKAKAKDGVFQKPQPGYNRGRLESAAESQGGDLMKSSLKRKRKRLRDEQGRRDKNRSQIDVAQRPGEGVRMSDVLRHVAEPIVASSARTTEDLEAIIRLTIAAWNLPESRIEKEM